MNQLSNEQQLFIDYALAGHNILVEACIGSGKTTAIQALCNRLAGKRVLYLTYNKLLKLDAKARIRNGFVTVTNYHGFAWQELRKNQMNAGVSDLIQAYNRADLPVFPYDVLILDEYQDIDQEIADMLTHIKEKCPRIQIVAVGDMCQKIYDKTTLDVGAFIHEFLGNYIPMEFTQCFRLGSYHAAMLGRVWGKTIVGVNEAFRLDILPEYEARRIASQTKPKDLLVLGSRDHGATRLQNYLEDQYPDIFNKHTLWSKVFETSGATSPTPDCAIFTTYDGCKGMERKVCILYDWDIRYWMARSQKPDVQYDILRNLFCVAASRGKQRLILIDERDLMDEETLSTPFHTKHEHGDMRISGMFSFKRKEDLENAYQLLQLEIVDHPGDPIHIPISDGLIDLSFCVGTYAKAMYFANYNLDAAIEDCLASPDKEHLRRGYKSYDINRKLLYLAMLETGQNRYMNQVRRIEVSPEAEEALKARLSTHLTPEETAQAAGYLTVLDAYEERPLFSVRGMADVLTEDAVWMLTFTEAIPHEDVLQAAVHMIAQNKDTGYVWNLYSGERLKITIPDRDAFLDIVGFCVTKGVYPETIWE